MKNLIVFVLPIVLLLSSGAVNAQGKSKEAKMNKVKMEKKIRMTRKIKVIKKTRIHSLKNL
jgi:hypothetical protein